LSFNFLIYTSLDDENEPRNERLNECCAAAESLLLARLALIAPVPKFPNSPKIPHEFKKHLTDLTLVELIFGFNKISEKNIAQATKFAIWNIGATAGGTKKRDDRRSPASPPFRRHCGPPVTLSPHI
jgi:hypothetical protein